MFIIESMDDDHPTYTRLMLASAVLKKIATPSAVGELLGVDNPSQMLENWRSRGVPLARMNQISRSVGCNPLWLEDGVGDMVFGPAFTETVVSINRRLQTMEAPQIYKVSKMIDLLDGAGQNDDDGNHGHEGGKRPITN